MPKFPTRQRRKRVDEKKRLGRIYRVREASSPPNIFPKLAPMGLVHCENHSLFTPGPIHSWSESSNTTQAKCSMEPSLPGSFVPWNFCSLDLSFHGIFASRNFSSQGGHYKQCTSPQYEASGSISFPRWMLQHGCAVLA